MNTVNGYIKNDLPTGWEWVKLKDVCTIISGKRQDKVQNEKGEYPIYGSSGIFGYANDYLCEEGSTVIGRKGTINNPIFVQTKFWNVDTAFGIKPNKRLGDKLFYYFCKGFNFHHLDKSTTIPSLAKSDLLEIDIPLPPIDEQRQIVSKIEELFSELDKSLEQLGTAQQQLTVYSESVSKWAFDGKLTNSDMNNGELPQDWKEVPLGDLMESVKNGYSKRPDDKGNYKILRISAVRPNSLDLEEFRNLKAALNEENEIRENDLLFTRYNGSREFVGVSAKVPKLNQRFYYPDKLIRCRPKIKNKYHSLFLQYASNTGKARNYILGKIKTTAGQTGISGGEIKQIPISLPPLVQQKAIVQEIESRLSVANNLKDEIIKSLQQAEGLKQSILKKAFGGDLSSI